MALEGTLKDFSIADIFQLIGYQRKTGILTLKAGDEVVTVSFVNGEVVWSDSLKKRLEDMLGYVLVKSGIITEEKLEEALQIQKETLQRMGNILVNNGFIKETDLQAALSIQVTQIIYRLFRWTEGDYNFKQQDSVDYDREHFTPIKVETILMEGMRMLDEWPIIEKRISSKEMVFIKKKIDVELFTAEIPKTKTEENKKTADSADDLSSIFADIENEAAVEASAIKLNPEEEKVYELVDGVNTVRDIIEKSRINEFDTCKALFDMMERDLIEEYREEEIVEEKEDASKLAKKGKSLSAISGIIVFVIALIAMASLVTSWNNPFSFYKTASRYMPVAEDIKLSISRNRLEKINFALQVYFFNFRKYPSDLSYLVASGIVSQKELMDPWGRPYSFELGKSSYLVYGFNSEGGKSQELVVYHKFLADVQENDSYTIDIGQ